MSKLLTRALVIALFLGSLGSGSLLLAPRHASAQVAYPRCGHHGHHGHNNEDVVEDGHAHCHRGGNNDVPDNVDDNGHHVDVTNNSTDNQDFGHTVTITLVPGLQATGATVSVGNVSVLGNQIFWTGFVLGAGQTVSLDFSSSGNGGPGLIQSIVLDAVDVQTGGHIVEVVTPAADAAAAQPDTSLLAAITTSRGGPAGTGPVAPVATLNLAAPASGQHPGTPPWNLALAAVAVAAALGVGVRRVRRGKFLR